MIERSEQGADPVAATAGSVGTPPDGPAPPGRSGGTLPPPGAPVPRGVAGQASEPRPATGDTPLNQQLAAGGAPIDRGSAWVWVLFAALGWLGGQILALVLTVIAAAVTGNSSSLTAISKLNEPPTWYLVASLLGIWGGFFGAAWMATANRGTKSFRRDFGLRFRWIDLLGIAIGFGGQLLVVLLYIPIRPHVHDFSQRFNGPSQKLTGGSHGVSFVIIAILTVVGPAFFEELFFRGVLLRSLGRLFGFITGWVGSALAIITTGLIFGMAHGELLQLPGLALFGVILSFVSFRTGRLGMNMVAHASFNLLAVAAAVIAPLAVGHGVPV